MRGDEVLEKIGMLEADQVWHCYRLHIVGETFVDVNHCLVAAPGATKSDIRRVISHPQARSCHFVTVVERTIMSWKDINLICRLSISLHNKLISVIKD